MCSHSMCYLSVQSIVAFYSCIWSCNVKVVLWECYFPNLKGIAFLGTIGFVETLIEVNESIGEATVNVNMRLNSSIQFEIMFSLFANTMIDSSGVGNATQHFHLSAVIIVLYISMLQLVSIIIYLGMRTISGLRTYSTFTKLNVWGWCSWRCGRAECHTVSSGRKPCKFGGGGTCCGYCENMRRRQWV